MDFSPQLLKGSIQTAVLALLRERPMYGYEMVKHVNARTGGRLEWREGTLYPALHRLESQGLLSSRWRDVPGTGAAKRRRKYYSITRRGRTQLAQHTSQWREFSLAINRLLAAGNA